MESTQTITEGKEIRMTIDIYLFLYARKVVEEVRLLTRKHCFGCRNNHPSQRNHSCLMMSELEQLNIYFDDALENKVVDEKRKNSSSAKGNRSRRSSSRRRRKMENDHDTLRPIPNTLSRPEKVAEGGRNQEEETETRTSRNTGQSPRGFQEQ
ncbi:unnamed protein product [Mytilus edulis]|uniref:Uncharacterized protein n=1 Tax=Mytilus edulis TaxID=6550 RepID=A0A8S3RM56_MYTED|nr:unnamed protein product [Mytilus edulis]